MNAIIYGDLGAAREARQKVVNCHTRVGGITEFGEAYHAHNPLLKLWVLATLIDSVLVVHDQFVRPLSLAEKESYYADSIVLGRLLGIPSTMMPATYARFVDYVQAMLASETLTVSVAAREVARALFSYPFVGGFLQLISFAGLGLLPATLKNSFDIKWDEPREIILLNLAACSRWVRALLPDLFCATPFAWVAEWRWRFLKPAVIKS
jgi:uncharacterized protein (DUF2236 family)